MYINNRLEEFIVPRVLWSWRSSFFGFVGGFYDVLGPSQIVLECNTKVPMLVDLLQPSRAERDVNGVLGVGRKGRRFSWCSLEVAMEGHSKSYGST